MSEILLGVLRMPPVLWSGDYIDVNQRHGRYVEAADEIERLRSIIDRTHKLCDAEMRDTTQCGDETASKMMEHVSEAARQVQ